MCVFHLWFLSQPPVPTRQTERLIFWVAFERTLGEKSESPCIPQQSARSRARALQRADLPGVAGEAFQASGVGLRFRGFWGLEGGEIGRVEDVGGWGLGDRGGVRLSLC